MISSPNYEYRTGIGTDIHRLGPERQLFLCGVHVPFPLGLIGHSDGDVALHAMIDALLGAMAKGDIGTFFPDTDPTLKDIDSRKLVEVMRQLLEAEKWQVVNIDVTITAEEPKLGTFKGQMKRCIAGILGIDFAVVNIKAKTNEGLDAIGAGQAISATAAVLLKRRIKRKL